MKDGGLSLLDKRRRSKKDCDLTSIYVEQSVEAIRQEREKFNDRIKWSSFKRITCYVFVIFLGIIMGVASYALINNDKYPATIVVAAEFVLFFEVLGLLGVILKTVLSQDNKKK